MRTLTPEESKRFYDRFGAKQDRQSFYEAPALDALESNLDLAAARSVFELGCGTGRFAAHLLQDALPPDARYVGVDLSTTMLRIAGERLERFAPRAVVLPCAEGEPRFPVDDSSVDRVVSTYVLDLLPEPSIHAALREARRVLRPGGLLGLVGITSGATIASRLVMGAWMRVFERKPEWLGGCRPLELGRFLGTEWTVRFREVVVAWGIASEVIVASPRSR